MKKLTTIITSIFALITTLSFAQSDFTQVKAGHSFDVSLPNYMSKTSGLNTSAAIQYKNAVKDVYGIIIFDTKEDLDLVELKYSSINEFYDDFVEDFLKDEENRKVSKSKSQTKDGVNFLECDISYYDKDAKTEIYYLVGVVETKNAYYKVLSWTAAENKDKFKSDFQKILYSVKD